MTAATQDHVAQLEQELSASKTNKCDLFDQSKHDQVLHGFSDVRQFDCILLLHCGVEGITTHQRSQVGRCELDERRQSTVAETQ